MSTKIDFFELKKHFSDAEIALKTVEEITQEVLIPSVNQLRYAGRHLTDLLTETDQEKIDHHFKEFFIHCNRAERDAWEVGIISLLNEIKEFDRRYLGVTVSDIIPNYVETRKKINQIRDFLSTSPQNGQEENKIHFKEKYLELKDIYYTYDLSISELNKKLKNQGSQVLYTILGIIIALIGLIYTLTK